jgi:hypothetical protein
MFPTFPFVFQEVKWRKKECEVFYPFYHSFIILEIKLFLELVCMLQILRDTLQRRRVAIFWLVSYRYLTSFCNLSLMSLISLQEVSRNTFRNFLSSLLEVKIVTTIIFEIRYFRLFCLHLISSLYKIPIFKNKNRYLSNIKIISEWKSFLIKEQFSLKIQNYNNFFKTLSSKLTRIFVHWWFKFIQKILFES